MELFLSPWSIFESWGQIKGDEQWVSRRTVLFLWNFNKTCSAAAMILELCYENFPIPNRPNLQYQTTNITTSLITKYQTIIFFSKRLKPSGVINIFSATWRRLQECTVVSRWTWCSKDRSVSSHWARGNFSIEIVFLKISHL